MSKISIIVPVYNALPFLDECIDSIRSQDFTDWELMLVDDGSTDGSGSVCDRAAEADARIRVLHIDNGGQARARNHGLDLAVGRYITFVDADDRLLPGALRTMIEAERAHGGDAVIVGGFTRGTDTRPHAGTAQVYTAAQAIEHSLYQRGIEPNVWARLFPTELFRQIRFVDGLYYEDLEIFYRLLDAHHGPVVELPDTVYYYRPNPGSFINTWSERRLDVLTVTDALVERYGSPAARSRRLSAAFNMFVLAGRHGRRDVADRCWLTIKAGRHEAVADRRVRLKNKAAALLSYLGRRAFTLVARM